MDSSLAHPVADPSPESPKQRRTSPALPRLPLELISEICLFLPVAEIYSNVGLACKRFRNYVVSGPFVHLLSTFLSTRYDSTRIETTFDFGRFQETFKTLLCELGPYDFVYDYVQSRFPHTKETSVLGFTSMIPWFVGGPRALSIVYPFPSADGEYWLYLTIGFSHSQAEFEEMATPNRPVHAPGPTGFGYELVIRVKRDCRDPDPDVDSHSTSVPNTAPRWPDALLGFIARYVFTTGNELHEFDGIPLGSIMSPYFSGDLDAAKPLTDLYGIVLRLDSEFGVVRSFAGPIRILELVALTEDEYQCRQQWSSEGLLEMLFPETATYITDLKRRSRITPSVQEEIDRRMKLEVPRGGSTYQSHPEGRIELTDDFLRLVVVDGIALPLIKQACARLLFVTNYEIIFSFPGQQKKKILEFVPSTEMMLEDLELERVRAVEDGTFDAKAYAEELEETKNETLSPGIYVHPELGASYLTVSLSKSHVLELKSHMPELEQALERKVKFRIRIGDNAFVFETQTMKEAYASVENES